MHMELRIIIISHNTLFPDIFKDKQLTNKSGVLRVISDKVREATHLPEISLQNTALHVDAHRMFFLGTLLNRPPAQGMGEIKTKNPHNRYKIKIK